MHLGRLFIEALYALQNDASHHGVPVMESNLVRFCNGLFQQRAIAFLYCNADAWSTLLQRCVAANNDTPARGR